MKHIIAEDMIMISTEIKDSVKDLLSELLTGLNAHSVSEMVLPVDGMTRIEALFPKESDTKLILSRLKSFESILNSTDPDCAPPEYRIELVDHSQWEHWKNYLKTIRISERMLVGPPWEENKTTDKDLLITINPSLAFGTGHHETTRLCLRSIEEICKKRQIGIFVDAGCGSGILSIAAVKLGVKEVYAFDTDFIALKETVSNMRINGDCNNISLYCGTINNLHGIKADLIVANISAHTLGEMSDQFTDKLSDRGVLILSGITSEREKYIKHLYELRGFHLETVMKEGDWVSLIFSPDR